MGLQGCARPGHRTRAEGCGSREGRRREGCRLRERRHPSPSVWAKSVSFRAKQEKLVLSERPISRAVTLFEMSYLFKAARVPFSVNFQKEATRVKRGGASLCCNLPTSSSGDRRGSRATWRGASWSAGCYVTARSPRPSPPRPSPPRRRPGPLARPPGVPAGRAGPPGGGAGPRLPPPAPSARRVGKRQLRTHAQPGMGFRLVSPCRTRKVVGAL